MSEAVQNAKTLPKRYFGLHMVAGVAEYHNAQMDGRILVEEPAIKNMDPTFEGKPVYVDHVDDVNLDKLQAEADGYVVRSFYNKSDGKHWVEFLVVSDRGHEAIAKGWKLSNAYVPKSFAGGGTWHAVDYQKEVKDGVYEHLAIVSKPRYEESIILTPEEFKAYNSKKEQELIRLSNSKEKRPMFKIFKRDKVEDAEATKMESLEVQLKNGKTMSIAQLVNVAEEHEEKYQESKNDSAEEKPAEKKEEGAEKNYANGEHMVKVGDKEMTVNALVKLHHEMMSASHAAHAKNMGPEAAGEQNPEPAEDKKNDEMGDDEAHKKALELAKHEESEMALKHSADETKIDTRDPKHFEALKNAREKAEREEEIQNTVDTDMDQLARGRKKYGSDK